MNNDENNLLSALSAIQGQLIGLQTNLNFVQQSIAELKQHENDTRVDLTKFATATRDRLKTVENQVDLIKWGLILVVGTVITIGTTRLLTVMSAESKVKLPEKSLIQQEMIKPLETIEKYGMGETVFPHTPFH